MSTHDGYVLIPIDLLDNPLTVLGKITVFDEFPQHLIIESDKYASQNNRRFVISFDGFWTFININYTMGYHKLPNLWSYWALGNPFFSENYVANVIARDRFVEILTNLHFSNKAEALPRDNPDQGQ